MTFLFVADFKPKVDETKAKATSGKPSFFLLLLLKCKIRIPFSSYFSDSKMDGLDDALVHQTKMHHESFLPISVGTSSAKASADIVTFFALAASTLKYYYHHYWTTRSFSPVLLLSSLWQQKNYTNQVENTVNKRSSSAARGTTTAHFHFWKLKGTVFESYSKMSHPPSQQKAVIESTRGCVMTNLTKY